MEQWEKESEVISACIVPKEQKQNVEFNFNKKDEKKGSFEEKSLRLLRILAIFLGVIASIISYKTIMPPKYEYSVEFFTDNPSSWEKINEMGAMGWDAVSARRAKNDLDIFGYEVIFKRIK